MWNGVRRVGGEETETSERGRNVFKSEAKGQGKHADFQISRTGFDHAVSFSILMTCY